MIARVGCGIVREAGLGGNLGAASSSLWDVFWLEAMLRIFTSNPFRDEWPKC